MNPNNGILCCFIVLVGTAFTFPLIDFEERLVQLKRLKKVVPLTVRKKDDTVQPMEAELGKILFNDKRFSKNNNLSCSSCHMENRGFSNGEEFAIGTNGNPVKRHVPHLYNLELNNSFFWDGRATSLEEQLSMVIKSKTELDMTFKEVISRLEQDDQLREKFKAVYAKEGITKSSITKSIVAFERSIVAVNSKYDQYLNGNKEALNEKELAGLALFIGPANCIACHNGPNLSDKLFHNVGIKTDDLGRQSVDQIGMNKEFESTPYPFFSTFKAFKTPSLRNIAQTAPYFHNGSKKTLEEVVAFYNSGGENPNKSGLAKEIVPLNLSKKQEAELIAFLLALSSNN
jgi:cytochrome c peroxidase